MSKTTYKRGEVKFNKAIDRACFALGGMLHIPTADAIKYFYLYRSIALPKALKASKKK